MKNKNSFEKNSLFVLICSILASGLNYLFQVFAGRLLTPESYGDLTAAFAVVNVISVLGTAMSVSIAKYCAENSSDVTTVRKAVAGCLYAVPGISIAAALIVWLGLKYDLYTAALISVSSCCICVSSLYYGYLQGQKLFGKINTFNLIQPGVKLVLGTLLIYAGLSYRSVFYVLCVGAAAAVIYSGRYLYVGKNTVQKADISGGKKAVYKYFLFCLPATACLVLFSNIDVLLIRSLFDEAVLGQYSSIALFGKIILYIPTAVVTVMIPMAAENKTDKSILNKSLLLSFCLSFAAAAGLFILKKPLITLIMGEKYLSALTYTLPVCVMMLPLALVTVMINYLLAQGRKKTAVIGSAVAGIVMTVLVIVYHPNVTAVIYELAIVYTGLFAALWAAERSQL